MTSEPKLPSPNPAPSSRMSASGSESAWPSCKSESSDVVRSLRRADGEGSDASGGAGRCGSSSGGSWSGFVQTPVYPAMGKRDWPSTRGNTAAARGETWGLAKHGRRRATGSPQLFTCLVGNANPLVSVLQCLLCAVHMGQKEQNGDNHGESLPRSFPLKNIPADRTQRGQKFFMCLQKTCGDRIRSVGHRPWKFLPRAMVSWPVFTKVILMYRHRCLDPLAVYVRAVVGTSLCSRNDGRRSQCARENVGSGHADLTCHARS